MINGEKKMSINPVSVTGTGVCGSVEECVDSSTLADIPARVIGTG